MENNLRNIFGARTTAFEVIKGHDLAGKNVIITGATNGIGVETARALAKAGASVLIAARRQYDSYTAYGQSKTANALFAVELTRRFKKDGIYANAVMPGLILTGLQKHTPPEWIKRMTLTSFKTIEQGAATSVWAAVAPELEECGGLYLDDCNISTETTLEAILEARTTGYKDGVPVGYLAYAVDPIAAEQLWNLTEKMILESKTRSVLKIYN